MITNETIIHVMYSGTSYDIDYSELNLDWDASDIDIKSAVATWLNTPISKINNFVLDKSTDGNITLRPQAVFGR